MTSLRTVILMSLMSLMVLMLWCTNLSAQADTASADMSDHSSIRRKMNVELMLGLGNGVFSSQSLFKGAPIPGSERNVKRFQINFGIGIHQPLVTLGEQTTLWLVPAAILGIHLASNAGETTTIVDLSAPVHATIGYGGLRRRSAPWGIEGGLGFTAAHRFHYASMTLTPSATAEITYAPKWICRLRVIADLIASKIGDGKTYQSWTLQLVGNI